MLNVNGTKEPAINTTSRNIVIQIIETRQSLKTKEKQKRKGLECVLFKSR